MQCVPKVYFKVMTWLASYTARIIKPGLWIYSDLFSSSTTPKTMFICLYLVNRWVLVHQHFIKKTYHTIFENHIIFENSLPVCSWWKKATDYKLCLSLNKQMKSYISRRYNCMFLLFRKQMLLLHEHHRTQLFLLTTYTCYRLMYT